MVRQLERDRPIAAGADRRRPGRVEHANPHLIALLRSAPRPRTGAGAVAGREADMLAAARGIGLSTALGTMAWTGFLLGLWLLLHA